MRRQTSRRRAPMLAALALCWLWLAAPTARAAHWAVAAPGPCAEIPARDPCKEGACEGSNAPARGRFDPASVASGPARLPGPLPDASLFTGPGSCADSSNHCGQQTPTNRGTPRSIPGLVEQPPVPVLPPGVPQP
jgi:hypothetical protein